MCCPVAAMIVCFVRKLFGLAVSHVVWLRGARREICRRDRFGGPGVLTRCQRCRCPLQAVACGASWTRVRTECAERGTTSATTSNVPAPEISPKSARNPCRFCPRHAGTCSHGCPLSVNYCTIDKEYNSLKACCRPSPWSQVLSYLRKSARVRVATADAGTSISVHADLIYVSCRDALARPVMLS